MPHTVERIQYLLGQYKEKTANYEEERFASIRRLLSDYRLVKPRLAEINQYEAEGFSIFNALRLEYSEVRLHTPILAHLLNPNGSHAQGDLFYRQFIELILEDEVFKDYDPHKIIVKRELSSIGFGQMDIFIEHKHPQNYYAFVIENKINALDQPSQLLRYKGYLDSLPGVHAAGKRLIYLKPLQAFPSESSVDAATLADWISSRLIKTISYKVEINDWLTSCIDRIKAPSVRMIVEQYLKTLKTICYD